MSLVEPAPVLRDDLSDDSMEKLFYILKNKHYTRFYPGLISLINHLADVGEPNLSIVNKS